MSSVIGITILSSVSERCHRFHNGVIWLDLPGRLGEKWTACSLCLAIQCFLDILLVTSVTTPCLYCVLIEPHRHDIPSPGVHSWCFIYVLPTDNCTDAKMRGPRRVLRGPNEGLAFPRQKIMGPLAFLCKDLHGCPIGLQGHGLLQLFHFALHLVLPFTLHVQCFSLEHSVMGGQVTRLYSRRNNLFEMM